MHPRPTRRSKLLAGRAQVWWGALCVLGLGLLSLAQSAAAQGALRVLLLAAPDAELSERIRGQTADLPVSVRVDDPSPAPPSRAVAAALARKRQADLVLWTQHREDGELDLLVWSAGSGSLQRRRVVMSQGRSRRTASAIAEITALLVRSELSARLRAREEATATRKPARARRRAPPRTRHEVASVPARDRAEASDATSPEPHASDPAGASPRDAPVEDEAAVSPLPPPAEPRKAQVSSTPAPARAGADPRAPSREPGADWLLSAGYRGALPANTTLSHAAALSLRYRAAPRLRVGVHGTASSAFQLEAAPVRLDLRRYGAGGHALYALHRARHTELALGLSAELGLYHRRSRTGPDLTPTRSKTRARAVVGATMELSIRVMGPSSLALGVGANFVTYPARFTVEQESISREVARIAWIEPWLGLALGVDL